MEHPALESYTPDGFVQALEQVIQKEQPALVLLPHTYQTRDFAPKAGGADRLRDHYGLRRRQAARRATRLRPADVPGEAVR